MVWTPSWVTNVVVFGLGLVSVVGGYRTNSVVVTVCGAIATIGSFISFLLVQHKSSHIQANTLDDRLRELEAQLTQAQNQVATMQRNFAEPVENHSLISSSFSSSSSTRRRSLPRPPSSSPLADSSSYSGSSQNDSMTSLLSHHSPPPFYSSSPPNNFQYLGSRERDDDSQTSFLSSSSPSKLSYPHSSSISTSHHRSPPPYLPSDPLSRVSPSVWPADPPKRHLLKLRLDIPTTTPDIASLSSGSPNSKSPSRFLPPPPYSHHENPSPVDSKSRLRYPDHQPKLSRPQANLGSIPESRTQDALLSPLRYVAPVAPEYNIEDHPKSAPSDYSTPQTLGSKSRTGQYGIKRHGKTIIGGIREKIVGRKGVARVTRSDTWMALE